MRSTSAGSPIYKIRNKVSVIIYDGNIIVKSIYREKLTLRRTTAQDSKLSFANQLLELSAIVQKQQQKAKSEIIDITDESLREEVLQQSLSLSDEICLEQLDKLRKIGSSLRNQISTEIIEVFQKIGFLGNKKSEPSLSFIEDIEEEDAQSPILWDMMHEKGQREFDNVLDERNWERFWGFRVPITHWISGRDPSEEIRLKNAFSAIHEDLNFAVQEEKLLQRNFSREHHQSLAEAFKLQVNKELKRKLRDEIKVQSWWETCKPKLNPNHWLKYYIEELTLETSTRNATRWTEDTLISIFKNCQKNYDLLHFACHCEVSDKSEFLSVLNMKVAGVLIPLDVATIANELIPDENDDDDEIDSDDENRSGRLVFLNACDSGAESSSHAPPGFPDKWIQCQNASAVIVTLCKIPDYFAYAFAEKFYENLFKDITQQDNISYVSEALLETRRYFMEKHQNPLGLAYVLYAREEAHIKADFFSTTTLSSL
jgi:CHAT domain